MRTVLYTKYNKLRREEFRIATMICEDNGAKYVEKKALNAKAKAQIQHIYKNSLTIGKAYKHMDILIPENKEDRVVFEYVKGVNLESILVEHLDDFPELIKYIRRALDVITDIDEQYLTGFKVTDGYKEVFGGPWCDEGEPSSLQTNIDVLFDNIIIKDQKYICLDCEWVFDFPVPLKLVKYRCLFYFYQKYEAYLRKWADLTAFLRCFDISEEEKILYMNAERNFQMYVTGKDFENDYVYKYEQKSITLQDLFAEKAAAENRVLSLENDLVLCRQQLADLQTQLQGKYDHVKHLEGIVVEKSHEADRLLHELELKEQHVQNLTSQINQFHDSSLYKLKVRADGVKNKIHKNKG